MTRMRSIEELVKARQVIAECDIMNYGYLKDHPDFNIREQVKYNINRAHRDPYSVWDYLRHHHSSYYSIY